MRQRRAALEMGVLSSIRNWSNSRRTGMESRWTFIPNEWVAEAGRGGNPSIAEVRTLCVRNVGACGLLPVWISVLSLALTYKKNLVQTAQAYYHIPFARLYWPNERPRHVPVFLLVVVDRPRCRVRVLKPYDSGVYRKTGGTWTPKLLAHKRVTLKTDAPIPRTASRFRRDSLPLWDQRYMCHLRTTLRVVLSSVATFRFGGVARILLTSPVVRL